MYNVQNKDKIFGNVKYILCQLKYKTNVRLYTDETHFLI